MEKEDGVDNPQHAPQTYPRHTAPDFQSNEQPLTCTGAWSDLLDATFAHRFLPTRGRHDAPELRKQDQGETALLRDLSEQSLERVYN